MTKKIEIKELKEEREIITTFVPKELFKKYAAVMAVIKRNFDDPDQLDDWSLDLATDLVNNLELGPIA